MSSERKIVLDRIRLIVGNIALLDVEALVNAANESLVLGGGVAGAIKKFGGESIQEECERFAPIRTGQAVITGGGNLKARYVIHAVGPIYGRGNEDADLASATRNSLILARKKKMASVAFPALSTGIYGFPLKRAGEIMLRTTAEFLGSNEYPREVIFCLFDQAALDIFENALRALPDIRPAR